LFRRSDAKTRRQSCGSSTRGEPFERRAPASIEISRIRLDVQEGLTPLFMSRQRKALTRFGIYKIVKRHTAACVAPLQRRNIAAFLLMCSAIHSGRAPGAACRYQRHIRAWLGHVSLETTSRYAEITLRGKMAAVATCLPPVAASTTSRRSDGWRRDEELLKWLNSL
jgi:integrase/recombinase XerD